MSGGLRLLVLCSGAVACSSGDAHGRGRIYPARAVEAVEKVPFQKLMFEKWDTNIEKRLVFLCSNKIFAIFERVVGDFLRELSKRGVFRQSR